MLLLHSYQASVRWALFVPQMQRASGIAIDQIWRENHPEFVALCCVRKWMSFATNSFLNPKELLPAVSAAGSKGWPTSQGLSLDSARHPLRRWCVLTWLRKI